MRLPSTSQFTITPILRTSLSLIEFIFLYIIYITQVPTLLLLSVMSCGYRK